MSIKPLNLLDDDKEFRKLVSQIVGFTIIDKPRLYIIFQLAKHLRNVNGDVAEAGVYKGGSARILAKIFDNTSKTIHLFDTFSGMPKVDEKKDFHKQGDFDDTTLEQVRKYLSDCKNVTFHPGFFPDTALPVEDKSFCMVHLDVDIYTSVLDCCRFFYPRMTQGGIMIFDDYGWEPTPGTKKAVDEFFSDKPESICYIPTGQCFVIKI